MAPFQLFQFWVNLFILQMTQTHKHTHTRAYTQHEWNICDRYLFEHCSGRSINFNAYQNYTVVNDECAIGRWILIFGLDSSFLYDLILANRMPNDQNKQMLNLFIV